MDALENLKLELMDYTDDLVVQYFPTDEDGKHCAVKIDALNELAVRHYQSGFGRVAAGRFTLTVTHETPMKNGWVQVLADINQV